MEIIEYGVESLDDIYRIERTASRPYNDIVPGFMGDLLTKDSLKQILTEGVRFLCAVIDDKKSVSSGI